MRTVSKKLATLVILTACCWFGSATAAPYDKIVGPTATLEYSKGYLGYSTARPGQAAQSFGYTEDPACKRTRWTNLYAFTKEAIQKPAAAGRRVALIVDSSITTGRVRRICRQVVGFVPTKDRVYRVVQQTDDHGCTLSVMDKATGEKAPSFTMLGDMAGCVAFLSKPQPSDWAVGQPPTLL